MILPVISYENKLGKPTATLMPGNTSTGIYVELVYPKENTRHPWKTKRVRSIYQTFIIISKNNKIYFNDGSNRIVTLDGTDAAPKQYRGANLAAEMQTKLNAYGGARTFTVTYNVTTGIFTITADSAVTWQFNSSTAGFPNGIWATIGIDCAVAGGTLSATSISTNSTAQPSGVKTTGGRFIMKTGTNTFVVRLAAGADQTFSITGAHSAKTLAEAIRNGVCDILNITDFDFQWDESTKKYKGRVVSSGTVTLRGTQAGFTAEDTIGITVGADLVIATGASYTSVPNVRIHTSEEMVWDFGAGQTSGLVEILALLRHNLQSTATVKYQAHASNLGSETDDDWTGATFLKQFTVYNAELFLAGNPSSIFPDDNFASTPNLRFWRLEIIDKDNAAGYIEYGVPWGGEYFQLSQYWIFGEEIGALAVTEKMMTDGGAITGSKKARLFEWKGKFELIDEPDLSSWNDLFDYAEDILPFLFLMDLDNNFHPKSRYVLNKFRPKFKENQETFELYDMDMEVIESK